MSIYATGSAYATREKHDVYFLDPAATMRLTGRIAETLDFITEFQLLHPDMCANSRSIPTWTTGAGGANTGVK